MDIAKAILAEAETRRDGRSPFLLAIDGRCAAGKTTLAAQLARLSGCTVVPMDHFFLRPEQRTEERFLEPGGNVDRERFSPRCCCRCARENPFPTVRSTVTRFRLPHPSRFPRRHCMSLKARTPATPRCGSSTTLRCFSMLAPMSSCAASARVTERMTRGALPSDGSRWRSATSARWTCAGTALSIIFPNSGKERSLRRPRKLFSGRSFLSPPAGPERRPVCAIFPHEERKKRRNREVSALLNCLRSEQAAISAC